MQRGKDVETPALQALAKWSHGLRTQCEFGMRDGGHDRFNCVQGIQCMF